MTWLWTWCRGNLWNCLWVTGILAGLILLVTPVISLAQGELEAPTEAEESAEVEESAEAKTTVVLQLKLSADLTIVDFMVGSIPSISSHRVGRQLAVHGTEAQIAQLREILANANLLDELAPQYGSRESICETVRLYYVRDPAGLQTILTEIKAQFAPEVIVQGGTSVPQPPVPQPQTYGETETPAQPQLQLPMLILSGPPSQIDNLKRVIAAIDVPQPQVRLDLWAFQISGNDARSVAERSQQGRDCIATVSRLMRGYLQQLEVYALDQQVQNQRRAEELSSEPSFSEDSHELVVEAKARIVRRADTVFIIPSARGRHSLSLTETLTTILLVSPEEGNERRGLQQMMEEGLGEYLGGWLNHLAQQDPEALETWARLLKQEGSKASSNLARLLEATVSRPEGGQVQRRTLVTGVGSSEARRPLLPVTLLEMFWDEAYMEVARQSISNFFQNWAEAAKDWQSLPPDRLRKGAADVDVVLQTAEHALAQDIENLFLRPLLKEMQSLVSAGGEGGLSSSSTTSISVLSGTEAQVVGSTRSYFEVTQPARMNVAALEAAAGLVPKLQTVLPAPTKGDGRRAVARVRLKRSEDLPIWSQNLAAALGETFKVWVQESDCSLMLVGKVEEVNSALTLLRAAGVAAETTSTVQAGEVVPLARAPRGAESMLGGGIGGLPLDRLLALGLALSPKRIWSSMTDGADITFTPYVLPGGAAAELKIKFTVTHNDPETDGDDGSSNPPPPRITRVAKHEANTSVYVHSLDLFALSSLTLRTTHPRPDTVVPLLGQIPLLGRMFHFPKSPSTVHHESILMVYSTILPTGRDVGELLDFEVPKPAS